MAIDQMTLGGFCGTCEWHKWSILFPRMVLTDGALYVAQNGGGQGAFWLMDAIASHQRRALRNEQLRDFQLWELKVNLADHTARLECRTDSLQRPCIVQRIEYTDFDLESIRLFVQPMGDGYYCIMLPEEN